MTRQETITNCGQSEIVLSGAVRLPPGESISLPAGMIDRLVVTSVEPAEPVVIEVWPDNVIALKTNG